VEFIKPIHVSVKKAAEIQDTCPSEIYQQLARGELEAVKDGARTKITLESIERRAASLPKANIKLYVPRTKRAAGDAAKGDLAQLSQCEKRKQPPESEGRRVAYAKRKED
jgi:hypothetical protein